MKKFTILLAFVALFSTVKAQENTSLGSWTTSSTPALKVSESMFHNWSSTGTSQIDLIATFFGNYK